MLRKLTEADSRAKLCATPHQDATTGGQPHTVADAAAKRPDHTGADIMFVTRWPRSAAFA
ncbi:hypothetical protein J1783_00885 [Rahnella sp. L151-1A]|nr:hypothetical protein [Rahnella perminowiae]